MQLSEIRKPEGERLRSDYMEHLGTGLRGPWSSWIATEQSRAELSLWHVPPPLAPSPGTVI